MFYLVLFKKELFKNLSLMIKDTYQKNKTLFRIIIYINN